MAPASLWEKWRSPESEWVRSFAIVTTTPNASQGNRLAVSQRPQQLTQKGAGLPVR